MTDTPIAAREYPTRQAATGQRRWSAPSPLVLALALLGLVAVAYANAVNHPFLYDDIQLVLKNPAIRSLANIPALIGFGEEGFHFQSRWTRDVSYVLEYAVAGPWPPLFHLTNVILHAAVGLLVFMLFSRLTRNVLLGWGTAAVFLIHPINTEVVAHISGRRGLLAALFSLAALVLLHSYLRRGGIWRSVAAFAALYLGAFSKEIAVLAPLAFVLIHLYEDSFSVDGTAPSREAWWSGLGGRLMRLLWSRRYLYGALLLFTGFLAVTFVFLTGEIAGLEGSPGFYETSGPGLNALDRARIVGMALRLLLVPIGQSVDYSYDALGVQVSGLTFLEIVDMGVFGAFIVLTILGLARRDWIGFGGIWLAIFCLPYLGIIPWHEVFAERFLYLPSIGFGLALTSVVVRLARVRVWARSAAVAFLVMLALLTTATVLRNNAWASSKNLWQSAVNRYPTCARAHKALGDAHMYEARVDKAQEHYDAAVEILPVYLDAHIGRATAMATRREFNSALEILDKVLERWPGEPKALNLKGFIYQSLGDDRRAQEAYEASVASDPTFAEGYNNLGRIYVEQGDLDAAIEMYETALSLNPAYATALQNLAVIYRHGLEDEETAARYEEQAKELRRLQ